MIEATEQATRKILTKLFHSLEFINVVNLDPGRLDTCLPGIQGGDEDPIVAVLWFSLTNLSPTVEWSREWI